MLILGQSNVDCGAQTTDDEQDDAANLQWLKDVRSILSVCDRLLTPFLAH